MKKLFLMSLLVCVGILQSFAGAFYYTDERGVTWTLGEIDNTSAKIYSVSGYGEEVVIPEKVYDGTKEYTVTSLEFTFEGNKTLEKVTWPSTITTINNEMFKNCSNLKTVENTREVTYIAPSAFYGCENLTKINLGLCEIEFNAFWGCSKLQSIGELAKCKSISSGAFAGCSSLETIDLSMCTSVGSGAFRDCSMLQSLGSLNLDILDHAFSGCSSLVEIDLSACKYMGYSAFSGCTKLEKVIGLEKFKSIPDSAFSRTALNAVNLPVCTRIGSSAFNGCYDLQSVDLPVCTSITDDAFNGCYGLQSVNLPVCTYIGYSAFNGCYGLQSIDLSVCTSINDNAFNGCYGLQSVNLPVCTYIGSSAFNGCYDLQSVNLPACTSIGGYAFNGCYGLQSVDIPVCTFIDNCAFNGCSGLLSVDLPKVERIGFKAFEKSSITKISLPETLKDMGYMCFDKVTEYIFYGTQPAVLHEEYFASTFGDALYVIRVPESAVDAYRAADVWNNYKNKIFSISDQLDYDVKTTAMDSQSGLEQIIGATNMKKVVSLKATGTINGYDIFMIRTKMVNLQNLDLTDADIVANGFAYYENNSTTDNVVGNYSFYKLDNLVTLKLPKNAVTIGSYAMANCSSLESVDFPKNLKNIKDYSFLYCI